MSFAGSRMRPTRPSPSTVAPPIAGTSLKGGSSDLMTICCWPTISSTPSAMRSPAASTITTSPSGSTPPSSRKTVLSLRNGMSAPRIRTISPLP